MLPQISYWSLSLSQGSVPSCCISVAGPACTTCTRDYYSLRLLDACAVRWRSRSRSWGPSTRTQIWQLSVSTTTGSAHYIMWYHDIVTGGLGWHPIRSCTLHVFESMACSHGMQSSINCIFDSSGGKHRACRRGPGVRRHGRDALRPGYKGSS